MMLEKINRLYQKFTEELGQLQLPQEVLNLKAAYLGKKGHLSDILQMLKDLTEVEKKAIGPLANEIKDQILCKITAKISDIEQREINAKLAQEKMDLALRDSLKDRGVQSAGLHPLTIIQREIEDVFLSMGFEVIDGPHIEDDYHNFEALNIPADHPARDMQDTFWFADGVHLLRTHTSTVQVRGMQQRRPPFRFIAPGKVFRCERTDASHDMVFHQTEGMMVGKDISVGNLIYFMRALLTEIFKKNVEVRLRPGFFPFVEPGFELDVQCLICQGKGCSVCKQVGWLELLPCGMIHPNVLKMGGIDPTLFNGFVFGLGLDRLVMMRYGIDDIRHLQSGDLRFLTQFKEF